MKNNIVLQIALSGILTGLAILIGFFGNFRVFGGDLNLIGIVIFIMPFFLKIQYSVISTGIAVVITDLLNGWIAFFWISMIAYIGAVVIISLFKFIKLKIVYFILISIAAIYIIGIYYFLENYSISNSFAVKDLVSTSIEVGITWTISMIIYLPIKIVSKVV